MNTVNTTKDAVLVFMRGHSLAVEASVSSSDTPQAAAVGFVVTDDFKVSSIPSTHRERQRICVAIRTWRS